MKKKPFKFTDFDYAYIDDIKTIETEGEVVKVSGHVLEVKELSHQMTGAGKYRGQSRARIGDQNGNVISTSDFSKKMYRILRKYQKAGKPIEMLARVVKEETSGGLFRNYLKILKVRPATKPLRRLQASRGELSLIEKFLRSNSRKAQDTWWLFDAIKEELIERVKIVGTDMDELYSDALDVVICQAFSGGKVSHTNGKIHTCLIGPPASGKKLLWVCAQKINVVSQESHPIRTTEAGLTGTMTEKKGNWTVTPGRIPLANTGVFGIQDFDKTKKKFELLSILGMVMEDGTCLISGAAREKLSAEVAIHIDLNRRSDLFAEAVGAKQAMEDIELPFYILSRFDYITELEKNLRLQTDKSYKLLQASTATKTTNKTKIGSHCGKHGLEVDRFLKLIVAYVMAEFDEIEMGAVRRYMLKKFREIEKLNKDSFKKMPELASFQMRLVNSLQKFVIALTRVQLLDGSNKQAVDGAFHLLSRKLDFLKTVNEDYVVPRYKTTGIEAFQKWLCDAYGTKRFAPKKVISKYRREGDPCGDVSDRTLHYWLERIAVKKKHGVWKIRKAILENQPTA